MTSSCFNCQHRGPHSFCNLPAHSLIELNAIRTVREFAPGQQLFGEGQSVDDVIIICDGAASLTFAASGGGAMMLGVSEPGELLGLSSALSDRAHETTASAIGPTRVATIPREDFLDFMQHNPAAAQRAIVGLTQKVNRAYDKIRLVGSGLSVDQRVARWFLDTADEHGRLQVTLTHERIAQLLGVARESVTRSLSAFKRRGVLEVRGIQFYLRDKEYFQSLLTLNSHRNRVAAAQA
jgi:CRP/FNR family transcriptional regulator